MKKCLFTVGGAVLLFAQVGCPQVVPEPPETFVVNTTADTVDADPGDGFCADSDGNCSLRAAIQEANAAGGTELIGLQDNETYVLTREGAGEDAGVTGDLDITSTITLLGRNSIINADNLDRVFDVRADGELTISDINLRNGRVTDGNGGAVRNANFLSMLNSTISSCVAIGDGASGGALFNDGGTMNVSGTTINESTATRAGGAIEASGGTTNITACTLTDNDAGPTPGNGGAVHLTGEGNVTIRSCTILNNTATSEGGGIWNSAGTMLVQNCEISDNTASGPAADDGGGAAFNNGGMLTLEGCTIQGNSATGEAGSGGGVFNNAGTLIVRNSTLSENSAQRAGGGVEALTGTTTLDRVIVTNNTTGNSPGNGGGLHLTGDGDVTVLFSQIRSNTANAEGGGLWNSSAGTMTITSTEISDNTASGNDADQGGGGLFNDGGMMTVAFCNINENMASGTSGSGGGILNNDGTLVVRLTELDGNSASRAGGGIEANIGMTTLTDVTLNMNSTGDNPGNGGGIHVTGAGEVSYETGVVTQNDAASEGGGIWNSATGTINAINILISINTAPVRPDAFNDGGTFNLNGAAVPVGP
ncbi:MAG: right-handed parallel beta-helix repeat-containing protein [Phycisphaerae bacterium]